MLKEEANRVHGATHGQITTERKRKNKRETQRREQTTPSDFPKQATSGCHRMSPDGHRIRSHHSVEPTVETEEKRSSASGADIRSPTPPKNLRSTPGRLGFLMDFGLPVSDRSFRSNSPWHRSQKRAARKACPPNSPARSQRWRPDQSVTRRPSLTYLDGRSLQVEYTTQPHRV